MSALDVGERDELRGLERLQRRHPRVAERQGRTGRQDDRALQHVLELPDVARPVVALERLHDRRGYRFDRLVQRLRKRSEEHTSELQSLAYLVCRLLLEKKKKKKKNNTRKKKKKIEKNKKKKKYKKNKKTNKNKDREEQTTPNRVPYLNI